MGSVPLFFETFGRGFPLILVHGFPLHRAIWRPILPWLQPILRVVLPDLRGHGKSPDGNEIATMQKMAEDVIALMDRLEIEKIVIAGHSMGGYVAVEIANQYPGRIAGLALVGSHAEPDPPERIQARLATADRLEREGIGFLAREMAVRLTTRLELVSSLENLILENSARGAANAARGMAQRRDLTGFLSNFLKPALIIVGEADPFNPLERARKTTGLLRNGRLVTIPGGGHMPMMEEPERVAQALLDLVDRAVLFDQGYTSSNKG